MVAPFELLEIDDMPLSYEAWQRDMASFFRHLDLATKRQVNVRRLALIEQRHGVDGLLDVVLDFNDACQKMPAALYRFFEQYNMSLRTGRGKDTQWSFTAAGREAIDKRNAARKQLGFRTQKNSYVGEGGVVFVEPMKPKIRMRRDDADWNI